MKMIRLFLILTLITGILYPLSVTLISKLAFEKKASGSLISFENKVIGSSLIGQKFTGPGFFHSRPSAADYATVASGASQLSPTSQRWKSQYEANRAKEPNAGEDMWTTSGSGLDPHITPESAYAQVQRVSSSRQLSPELLNKLVDKHTEPTLAGIWGRPRVNVLELNMDIIKAFHGDAGTDTQ